MRRFVVRAVLAVVALAFVYFSVTFVQVWLASRRDDAREADAILVLGAAQYDGKPSPVLKARLDHAADLFEDGYAEVVVVTGGRRPGDRFTEASASANYLHTRGVPDESILREVHGGNTWDSLAAAAHFLRDRGIGKVLLVTDPFHSARVKAMARELGFDAHVSPTRSSPISGATEITHLGRESVAVGVGRIIGFRKLMGIDHRLERVREDAAALPAARSSMTQRSRDQAGVG